jgi:O-antigen/teichoic acid export membrane protein
MIQSLGLNAVIIVSFLVLARLLSTSEMGIWAILLLVVAACQTFATWFAPAVTKYVAENRSEKPRVAAAAFYQALRVTSVMYLPIVIGIYLGSNFIASRILGDVSYAVLFQILAIDIFFSAGVLPIVTAGLLGLQMFRETAIIGLVVQGFVRQSLIIALILLMRNITGLVIGGLVGDGTTAVIYTLLALRVLGTPKFDFPLTKLIGYSLPLELSQIASFAQTWFDRVLLVAFVPLSILGIYNVALTAFGVLTGVSNSIGNMLFPAYSSIPNRTGIQRGMSDAIYLALRYTSLILAPLALGLLATAKPALTLLVGESYVGGYLPLSILCGAFALVSFATALSPVLLALGETKLFALVTGITVPVGLAVAWTLLPVWGILAAATSRAVVMVLFALLMIIMIRRKITLRIDLHAIAKPLFAGVVMMLVVIAVQLVSYSKFLLPLYVFVGIVTYLIMLRALRAVDLNDMNLLRRFLGRLSPLCNTLDWVVASPTKELDHGAPL